MRGLLAACFAVALCGIACAEEHSTTKETGVYSCEKYAALFQIRPDEADATFFPWAMAYIGDVNSRSAGAFFDLNAMSIAEMKRYPWIAESALKNRIRQFVIDGEAVVLGVDGISYFNALHSG